MYPPYASHKHRKTSGLRWLSVMLVVSIAEARAHLGVEMQRQWSNLAILHTTPALLGLFSLVTAFAHQVLQ